MNLDELRSQPHLSASGIQDYVDCSLQYKFSRVDGLQREFHPEAMALGSAVHAALADFYTALRNGRKMGSGDLEEAFETHWRRIAFDRDDIEYQPGKDYNTLLLEGLALMNTYLEQLPQDDCRVVAVEEPFTFVIPHLEVPLIGVYDLVLEDSGGVITIVDHKVTSKAYSKNQVDKNFQLTVYQLAARANGYADREILLRLDCLIRTKTPRLEQYYTSRSELDELKAIRKILSVWIGISRRVFIPNDTSWKCTGCQFQQACEDWFRAAA